MTSPDLSTLLRRRLGEKTPVIAVASGKGGVGKSTVATQLAWALTQQGKKVGLLDADIYGPSVPHLLGTADQKPALAGDDAPNSMLPLHKAGIWSLSMGNMIPPDTAVAWRSPMVIKALKQFLFQIAWPSLDCLLIDMPPGTGDVHLTLAQSAPLTGAVIVSTPQSLSLLDAQKAVDMFIKVNVPLLGMVENMAVYSCPHCHEDSHPFGEKALQKKAAALNLPILGSLPLSSEIHGANELGLTPDLTLPEDVLALAEALWKKACT